MEASAFSLVTTPREGVNDDVVRVIEWLVADGSRVDQNQPLAVLETTKATFPLESPGAGFLFQLVAVGTEVPVGEAIAVISESPERPDLQKPSPAAAALTTAEQVISAKARSLMEEHKLEPRLFAGLAVVRVADVEAVLQKQKRRAEAVRQFRGETLDANFNWDGATETEIRQQIDRLLTALRKRMKAKFNRHLPTGELLHDRWELAKEYGFGERTSVYDSCLIMGEVRMGNDGWVGPYTILDGLNAVLTIGDSVDIGAGSHLYTHNTIERALTGRKAALFAKATTIGNCCFIAPNVVIAPGTVLGDHCFVAAGSYVEGSFPANSFIAGNPAQRVGVVEVTGSRARVRRLKENDPVPE